MRAVTWQGREDVQVRDVPDPVITEPTDAIIKVTSTAICGSDLHLYSTLGMYLDAGDVLGHEAMGVVEEVGSEARNLSVGDRVVIPFNISCGSCWMCERTLFAQCEVTQVREQDKGAAIFGYSKLYGQVPGGQAEYLRVPQAHFGAVVVPDDGRPDENYLFLSDVIPTAWQAVQWADVTPGCSVTVIGLGPIGQMAARIARHLGAEQVIGVDLVPERLQMARRHGIEVIDGSSVDDVPSAVRELTGGRGTDCVIDAVGMEAHGSPVAEMTHKLVPRLPDAVGRAMMQTVGVDRLAALYDAFGCVRRGGTVSISGVYGGKVDPIPMMDLFDKGVTIRMGQAHVRRWTDDILPLLTSGDDPLAVSDLVTHRVPMDQAPHMYDVFQRKADACIKVVLDPGVRSTPVSGEQASAGQAVPGQQP